VIKLGGSLITDKSISKGLDKRSLDGACSIVRSIIDLDFVPIIIHGAGSFGHILAKEWGIQNGADPEVIEGQRKAVREIRQDMRELSSFVIASLGGNGVRAEMLPPSYWANGTGPYFEGEVDEFARNREEMVPVTFGDVVDVQGATEFGILSGDDLMLRISKEVPEVTHSIFLMNGADGVLDKPPGKGGELVRVFGSDTEIEHEHESDVDVTGGIALKIDRAKEIAEMIGEVWIINGNEPARLLELLTDGNTIGTKIISGRGT